MASSLTRHPDPSEQPLPLGCDALPVGSPPEHGQRDPGDLVVVKAGKPVAPVVVARRFDDTVAR